MQSEGSSYKVTIFYNSEKPTGLHPLCSKRTLERRKEVLSVVWELSSGGDSTSQLTAEIKQLSKCEREELVKAANLPVVAIPPNHALAMKENLSIPWNKFRILWR